ncbi:hypothetical protein KC678_02130 [Candidatus Dojkabacteria bacterium]|uniref:Solute-binding protein family 5 domain-containing protein n=1 Tax=Candidatus Dojkabacteria bacterium TaxID=2099670 RepID=A0A955I9A7_9BACT|nr:hypothetical protein [Candidatus Dojkabacteria bacterium]
MFIFNAILKSILKIEEGLYKIRDAFWSYPDFFDPEKHYNKKLIKLYVSSVPYSHYILATLAFLLFTIPLLASGVPHVFGSTRGLLIEGVVMGIDSNGNVQKINKINPILPSNIQLEKDLVNLIYEPLIRYQYVEDESGKYVGGVQNILAKEIITLLPGANYEIELKKDVSWHDSVPGNNHTLSADDVIATFELYSSLSEDSAANIYSKTMKQLQWVKVDDYTIRVCTKPNEETTQPCDVNPRITYPIFSNFLELISFNIVPKKQAQEINSSNVDTAEPSLYRNPVGTGLYKLKHSGENSITVEINKKHGLYSNNIDITSIRFEYFATLNDAISALQNAEIHSLATLSVEYKDRLKEYTQIEEHVSDVLYNQFWGLYFNLRKRPDETSIAPKFLQDVRVREAISSSINRDKITKQTLRGVGEEAYGPIPSISYFFNPDAGWNTYDVEKAKKLLDDAGWKIRSGNEFRTNSDGDVLRFSLYFVDNFDRSEVAKSIKADLAAIGVDAVINRQEQSGNQVSESNSESWTLQELNDQLLSPGLFDVILYGMQTFVDPDRYELYHSSQTRYPGLNIAGYVSTEQTVDKNDDRQEGESSVIQVPKVDRFLDLARSFNPEDDRDARKDRYDTIQELIASDAPVVYLYHPRYLYFTNKAISDVDLSNADSLEERFINIQNWELN